MGNCKLVKDLNTISQGAPNRPYGLSEEQAKIVDDLVDGLYKYEGTKHHDRKLYELESTACQLIDFLNATYNTNIFWFIYSRGTMKQRYLFIVFRDGRKPLRIMKKGSKEPQFETEYITVTGVEKQFGYDRYLLGVNEDGEEEELREFSLSYDSLEKYGGKTYPRSFFEHNITFLGAHQPTEYSQYQGIRK
jgi:hypothetical protein